jgi:hypothetical protein
MGGIHIPVILRQNQRKISKEKELGKGISRKVEAVQGKIRVDTFQLAFCGEEEDWETTD